MDGKKNIKNSVKNYIVKEIKYKRLFQKGRFAF